MRASGIPARALYGRYIKDSDKYWKDDDTIHVRAEFFAEDVGWVPVDVAAATGNNPDNYFGQDSGDLLVLHFDTLAWEKTRVPLQALWYGFNDQKGTWQNESRSGSVRVVAPDRLLLRP
jgi:transglutaminase-like putative cysteine protease